MADLENSPTKRLLAARKSPPFHPYVRTGAKTIKSPQKEQSENPTFKHISDKNFFSFSGGSTSLFPNNMKASQKHSQTFVRSAMSELSNILNNEKSKQPTNQKIIGKADAKGDMGEVGIIGNQRQIVGFIPVESSCTIAGELTKEVKRNESFNCSFNSSFNDHLADLDIDGCSALHPTEKECEVLTEQVNQLLDFPEFTPLNMKEDFNHPLVCSAMSELSSSLKSGRSSNALSNQKLQETVEMKGNAGEVGIIGSQRHILGFIPVESSCTIAGESTTEIKRNESFNCSFNSSFNDNLANLGIDSCSTNSSTKPQIQRGILTEQVNPFFDFPEYTLDILTHWTEFERKVRPRWRFMDKQKDITHKMRTILVDWLVEVGEEYELQDATMFLSVSFVDRFLSKMAVTRGKLQLIGTAALFVASKYEEVSPPVIKDFVYITDETYSKEQLLRMEKIMLNVLNFDLMAPTSYDFCKAYCSLLQLNCRATCLALYLTELSLMDGSLFMNFLPSLIAIGAVGLARYTVDHIFWDDRLESLTKHRKRDVERTSQHLYQCFYEAPITQQTATYEKYKAVKYCSISLSMLPSKLPWRST